MTDLERTLLGTMGALGGLIVSSAITAFWVILNKISKLSAAVHGRIDVQEEKFVRRDDFKEFRNDIKDQLDKIDHKLDRIAENRQKSDT